MSKGRVTFRNFLLSGIYSKLSVFENKKKSPMVTVCNNLGADLKERSVCKSLPSLWSAAET